MKDKDKKKIDEEINENEVSEHVADFKEDNIDKIDSENNDENVEYDEEYTQEKEQEIVGAIGVVGPTRLNYSKIVPLVDYTSKIIGKVVK